MEGNRAHHTSSHNADETQNSFPSTAAQEAKTRERIRVLTLTLKPIPFRPTRAIDFARHETLLRRIGLWEFANVEFDPNVRVDLVAQLIGSFAPSLRYGYVNGVRVLVNRVQLGRVLKLPLIEKKKKGEILEGGALTGLNFYESIEFVEEFVRNWVVLHDDHDACDMTMLPSEVRDCRRLIRQGRLDNVDWGGLVWAMVEREMKDPGLVKCYYASHLQLLIRVQHEELLQDVPVVTVLEAEDEEKDENGDVRMGGVDFGKVESQGEKVEGVQKLVFEEFKEEPVIDMMNNVREPFLRSLCVNVNGFDLGKEKAEGEEGQQQPDEEEGEVPVMVVENEDGVGDMRMSGAGEFEEYNIELSVGGGDFGMVGLQGEEAEWDRRMDLEESKEEPVFNLNDGVGEPFLHQYDVNANGFDSRQEQDDADDGLEVVEEGKEEEEDAGDEEIPLQGMNEDRHHPMQALEAPFAPAADLNDDSLGDFISYQDIPQMTSGPSSFFGNGHTHRRDIDMDHHNTHPSLNGDNPYDVEPADFDICTNQIQHLMGEARSMYVTKYQSCEESTMNEQILLDELCNRDDIIDQLRKELEDESQKGQRNVHRLEKELQTMVKLLEGYRETINRTQKAFDEYRARCEQANEPYNKDVPGSKGL